MRHDCLMLFVLGHAVDVLDVSVVVAGQGIPADENEFLQHGHAVAQIAHAGTRIVGPAYRYFNHTETTLEGDEEDFGVKSPALDGLKLKDGLGGMARECLEAALGVGKRKLHDGPRNSIEATAEKLAIERLAMGLAAALEPAGADSDVSARGDSVKEPLGLLHGRGEVGVSEHDDLTQRLQDAGADTVTLATVAGVLDEAKFGCGLGDLADDVRCVVGRAVIDDDDLSIPSKATDAGDY